MKRRPFATLQTSMCRSIKPLFHFDPPVTADDVHAASLQFVRKITGFHTPSAVNQGPFLAAVHEIEDVCTRLLGSLKTSAPPKSREAEAAKARARFSRRFQS
jgi:hypothetical protein